MAKARRRTGTITRHKFLHDPKERHIKKPPERNALNDPPQTIPVNDDSDIATDEHGSHGSQNNGAANIPDGSAASGNHEENPGNEIIIDDMNVDVSVDGAVDEAASNGDKDTTPSSTDEPAGTADGDSSTANTSPETGSSESYPDQESPSSDDSGNDDKEWSNGDDLTPDGNPDGEEGCTVDYGNFGGLQGDSVKTIVSYRYEIETDSTYDFEGLEVRDYLETAVLPAVEDEISNALLAIFFSTRCIRRLKSSERNNPKSHRKAAAEYFKKVNSMESDFESILPAPRERSTLDTGEVTGRRILSVVGLSSRPKEEVIDGVSCKEQDVESSNFCQVVQGGLSLHMTHNDNESINEAELFTTLNTIRSGMNSGNFTQAHPAIKEIRFVDEELSNLLSADINTRSEVFAENEQLSSITFVAMGSVIAALIAGLVMYRRRRRATADSASSGDSNDESAHMLESVHSEEKDTAIGIHRNPAAPPGLAYGLSSDSEMESSYASTTPRSTDPTTTETMIFAEIDNSITSLENGKHLMPRTSELGANSVYPQKLLGDEETSDHGYDDDLLLH